MSALVGQTVSHYRILEHLGGGGMGVVYKARDLKLDRTVALKFLPPELTRDPEAKERFVHEAKAASALDHQNICVVHDIGETADSQIFIVMAFYEGVSLQQRIARSPLKVDEAIDCAIQIASGLKTAHESGIVHRDITPANVLITADGVVKIVDFGLAKLRGRTKLTRNGASMGTIAYKSPEQSRGEDVDQRTDIWSLGCIMYEMLTGQSPFRGDYVQAIVYSILDTQPEAVTALRSGIPMELEHIVAKCLQKNREERYQTAADVIADLKHLRRTGGELVLPSSAKSAGSDLNTMRWVAIAVFMAVIVALVLIFKPFSSAPEQSTKSIAVLPFTNLSDSREDEYFSDGITEDIIAQLSKVSDLKVISRTSIMQYKGVSKNVRDIGRELDVATVLEGSVRRAGNQIRIVAQLIDATNEGHLWADTYDKEITQVFSIQGDVAQRIAAALRARLSPSEKGRIEKTQTESTKAYELYLKGRFHWNKRMGDDLRMAVSYFTQAIEKDSCYALAYAGLAQTYVLFPQFFGLPTKDYYPRADSAARKALEYDVNLAEAYSALGIIAYLYTWDWPSAEREFRNAITLNPHYPTTHHWYCLMLNSMGRLGEAMNEIKRAQELDPLSPILTTNVGWVLFFMGRYDEAIGECERALALDRNFVLAHWTLGSIYCQKGMYATAIAEYQRVRMLVGHSPLGLGGLGYTYARSDSMQEARKILRELLAYREQNYLVSYEIALVYNGLMERDAALAWLERAFEERNRFVVDLNVDPAFRNLHSAPRFKSLLRKMRLEE